MVFFQALLLAGYGYAHLTTTRLGLRRQVVVHLVVLALPLTVLPMALPDGWRPPPEGSPTAWLVWVLLAVAGLPYFVVTTSSPLLQRWFSVSGHRRAGDPYFLYAAGNAGSIAGLIAYPLVIEPRFSLAGQARLWTAGYLTFALLSAVAALGVRRRSGTARSSAAGPAPVRSRRRPAVAVARSASTGRCWPSCPRACCSASPPRSPPTWPPCRCCGWRR